MPLRRVLRPSSRCVASLDTRRGRRLLRCGVHFMTHCLPCLFILNVQAVHSMKTADSPSQLLSIALLAHTAVS